MFTLSQVKMPCFFPKKKRNQLFILFCLTGNLTFASPYAFTYTEKDSNSSASSGAGADTCSVRVNEGKITGLRSILSPAATNGNQSLQEEKNKKFTKVRFSGFMRTWFFYRNLKESYDFSERGGLTLPVNISLGDGYDQPLIQLLAEATPFPATKFQAEFAFNNALLRSFSYNNQTNGAGRMASAWNILQFQAETYTDIGTFRMIAGGGVNYYRMSPLTLWSANDFNTRDDMFERLPWEPAVDDFTRYNSYYSRGEIPRDQRWGNAATQGIIIEGKGLPLGLNTSLLVGKGAASSGFQSYNTKQPLNLFAFRAEKMLGKHSLSYNFIDQFGHNSNQVIYKQIIRQQGAAADTFYVEDNRLSQLATTLDGIFRMGKVNLFIEAGAGSYLASLYNRGLKSNAKPGVENVSRYKRNWDEVLLFELSHANIPLKMSGYRIGRYFVNFSSSAANASVDQSILNVNQASTNTASFDGLIPMIGQLVNNRQGLNFLFSKNVGALKVKSAYGIAQEIENLAGDPRNGARGRLIGGAAADSATLYPYTNSITFQHLLNNLSRSRFGFWQRFGGPYSRIHNAFRRSFENIAITDTLVDYKKSYTSIDLELKYKFVLFGRPIILSNYFNYNTVQDEISILPKFNKDAFVKIFYEEFLVFYNLNRKFTLVGLLGYQSAKGNMRTELADADGNLITKDGRVVYDPKGLPVDQSDYAYGIGFDYNFHQHASLHLRQRWYTHTDKNFTQDRFRGNEATVELKVFF